jgi:hypothetical protein
METSPLVQQARPSFQPKIAQLYGELFTVSICYMLQREKERENQTLRAWQDKDDSGHSEGFWREFFLLKPDKPSLQRRLEAIGADDLLNSQVGFENKTAPLLD